MDLRAIAEDNNPWWRDSASRLARRYPFVRDLQAEVLPRLLDFEDRRATVILGPRQVGKTTLLLQTADMLLDRGWPAQNVTYFDFSDDRVTEPVTAREVVDIRPVGLDADHPRVFFLDEVHLAVEIQQVVDPDPAVDRLRDSLVDRLEPSPLPEEVQIAPVPHSADAHVLRIVVAPTEARRPYAFLKSGGRQFLVRIGNRIRNMSREEIRDLFARSSDSEQSVAKAIERVLNERQDFQKTAGERMWLRILPVGDLNLELSSIPLTELLEDPSKTGNRYGGCHVVQSSSGVRIAQERRLWSYEEAFDAEIRIDGGMRFTFSLSALHWVQGEEREIWPVMLLEYPISASRLASKIYDYGLPSTVEIVSDLALFGVRKWKLRAGSPTFGHFVRSTRPAKEYSNDQDLQSSRPLVFKYEEILDEPDRCGYRLVRRVYEAFGIRDEDMPRKFDPKIGRLVLPD
jgi:hypothetical protein